MYIVEIIIVDPLSFSCISISDCSGRFALSHFPTLEKSSIIGEDELSFRVRNGAGRFHHLCKHKILAKKKGADPKTKRPFTTKTLKVT